MTEPRETAEKDVTRAIAEVINQRTGSHMGAESWLATAEAILAVIPLHQRPGFNGVTVRRPPTEHSDWCDANGCRCGKCPCSCVTPPVEGQR